MELLGNIGNNKRLDAILVPAKVVLQINKK